ncbi:MAG: WecB/TagA/CpsF family glycosyltransferase [Anaerolineae bacterium]|nr:WecB/TagA/CpsF family glycosyltransferase [Anaerolineae bacterium]
MAKASILGVQTDAQTFNQAVNQLQSWASDSQGRYVCTCPVYTLMMCRENPTVMQAVNGADMVTADGMPVVWVQRRRGNPQAERVYGPDVMEALLAQTATTDIKHYFWGGLPGVADTLVQRMQTQHPSLKVAGIYSPPVSSVGDKPDPEVVERLNDSGADVIWVGLGSPKQDIWMMRYRPALRAPLLIGVGAAFDMLAGVKSQAPSWMQRSGLEWVFRLAQEPRRLGRRYLVYNPLFVWHVLKEGI